MNGTLRERNGKWYYRIDLGKVNGKRKQIERGSFKSSKEAKAAMQLAMSEILQNGSIKENRDITVSEVFESFIINEAPITRKHATIVRYQSIYNNHITRIGDRIIGELTKQDLQEFITKLVTEYNLSNDYVKSIYNFLVVLWNYADENKYLMENVIVKVKPPKEYRSVQDIKIYTLDEIKMIWDRIKDTNNATAFMLAFKLGLRAGEVYGLRWSDFDFDNNTVNICRQLQNEKKRWCFTTLKTPNSYRKIKFDNELKQYLLNLKNTQNECVKFYGDSYKTNKILDKTNKIEMVVDISDLVNIKPDGEMLNTNSCKVISRIVKSEFNIEFKMHNLRHTHATMLLEKGINPKYITDRLGHSKMEFTLKLYTHITRSMDEQAIDALNFPL